MVVAVTAISFVLEECFDVGIAHVLGHCSFLARSVMISPEADFRGATLMAFGPKAFFMPPYMAQELPQTEKT